VAYSHDTIKREIEALFLKGQLKTNDKTGSFFVWEARDTCRGPTQLENLASYCWKVYDKASSALGRQIIGRTGDIWTARLLTKYGLVDTAVVKEREMAKAAGRPPRKDLQGDQLKTLWKDDTTGNIQIMDKWSPVVNDAWVLGGVHRFAEFELLSIQAPGNLWDLGCGFHVVTARELLGLRRFGYQGERQNDGRTVFRCTEPQTARGATLTQYVTMMNEAEHLGANSVSGLISEAVPGLNAQIRSFDRTKLRLVK